MPQEQLGVAQQEAQAAHARAEAEAKRVREAQAEADDARDAAQALQQELGFARQRCAAVVGIQISL